MSRKLATIQRIKELLPIDGADLIELAIVNGWQAVVKKGDFSVNDQIVYIEIDAWVPHTLAPFLTEAGKEPKAFNGVQGQRLKTKKLRKQLSQGLILAIPGLVMNKLGNNPALLTSGVGEGDDVTEALGIQLWELPEEHKEKNGGNQQASKTRAFPYFLKKTDQERIQNYGHMVMRAVDDNEVFEATVKKDGSSMTVFRVMPDSEYYKDAKALVNGKPSIWQRIKQFVLRATDEPVYGICSRNVLLPLDGDSNFHKAAKAVLEALKSPASVLMDDSVAIQGEVVAPDIQGNYEKVAGVEFHMFDMYAIDRQEYELPSERRGWALAHGINHVKVVDKGTLTQILRLKEGDDVVKACLTYASGPGDNPGVQREGVVFKSEKRDFSFKAVSNEYLLKTGK